jgi:hypothetical protein
MLAKFLAENNVSTTSSQQPQTHKLSAWLYHGVKETFKLSRALNQGASRVLVSDTLIFGATKDSILK